MNQSIITMRFDKLPAIKVAIRQTGRGYNESVFSPVPLYPGHINTADAGDPPHYWHVTGQTHAMYHCQICPGCCRYVVIDLAKLEATK